MLWPGKQQDESVCKIMWFCWSNKPKSVEHSKPIAMHDRSIVIWQHESWWFRAHWCGNVLPFSRRRPMSQAPAATWWRCIGRTLKYLMRWQVTARQLCQMTAWHVWWCFYCFSYLQVCYIFLFFLVSFLFSLQQDVSTDDVAVSCKICRNYIIHHHHHHHLWLAPLWVRSATGRKQPPEWLVLGQVDCFGPWQPVGVEVVLHRLHPGILSHPGGLFQYSEGKEVEICLATILSSIRAMDDMPE